MKEGAVTTAEQNEGLSEASELNLTKQVLALALQLSELQVKVRRMNRRIAELEREIEPTECVDTTPFRDRSWSIE
ncbi:hypothetical protein CN97_12805 [Haematobacter massiliensis]|uniref:Uncharacterized protein n=1 Tax=Haematobacter massiliensis TaxID=195105 RepID=A0A086Y8U1_9RHOB|nr:hypothetical protein CN97_12805 [Haematobacter massiliensis]OWJ87451.1 hypothetical protein CDV51_06905 [Haematobacter massiliensis]